MEKAIFNWSGGKDSALALYHVLQKKEFEVTSLLTTLSEPYRRIFMHGVREALLDAQADALGLPLKKIYLPEMPGMEAYEETMRTALREFSGQGVTASIFGDIFLEDLRRYREEKLAAAGLKAEFPLWKRDTNALLREFLGLGFKTVITAVNERYLDKSFAGRVIDETFVRDLPGGVDPCGENGEYHTFVYDGPIFNSPVAFEKGELVYRKYASPSAGAASDGPFSHGFWFCELVPA